MSRGPRFAAQSAFHQDLRARVDAWFAERGARPTANAAMVAKMVAWIATGAAAWSVWVFAPLTAGPWVGMAALTGSAAALMTLNIGHDAVHGALSRRRWLNTLCSWSFDLIGSSARNWGVSHNGLHHSWTNVPGADPDIDPGPLLALNPRTRRPWHRWQHLYAPFVYLLVAANWVYRKDFVQIRWADPGSGRGADRWDLARMFVGKALHLLLFLVGPGLLSGQAWWTVVVGYAAVLGAAGLSLAVIFQMAHCVEGVSWPEPVEGRVARPWSEHQLHTTANFGVTPLSTWFTGGLDHQVEHHLLPHVCHIHLPALAPVVAACARDHGLPYLHSGSFPAALSSHFRTLRRLGAGPTEAR